MDPRESARFRATADNQEDFGSTPQEALNGLMARLSGDVRTPIVIWPYNRADAYFSDVQQNRLQDLKARRDALTEAECQELEQLVEASFDASISRTRTLPLVKT